MKRFFVMAITLVIGLVILTGCEEPRNCGAVMITNNDELLCTIKITDEERQSILNALK